jgi:peptidoglycan L-alanyl-D-glutamate endopeptidase CwlK
MSHQLFGDDVRFHQRILKGAGLYAGEIDAVWGPQTDAADQAFDAQYVAIRQELGEFDARSEGAIHTLLPQVQREARRFLARAQRGLSGLTVRILSGTRTYAEQDRLFAQGRNGNAGPIVTNARGGQSNHNFGIAWDIGLFDGGRYLTGATAAEQQAYRDVARIAKGDALEWGGDWTSFKDPPHYQIKTNLTLAQVQQRFEAGQAVV